MMIDHIRNTAFRYVYKTLVHFTAPDDPEVFEGAGSSAHLCDVIKTRVSRKLLIVTTPGLIKRGSLQPTFDALGKNKVEHVIFDAVEPNPSIRTVKAIIDLYHQEDCEGILAYGGGSVIDAAKAVALQIGNSIPLEKLIGFFKAKRSSVPFYIVPTTAGTGSEISSVSVLTDSETHQKVFIVDHKTLPIATALDPEPMATMPGFITADTGMDALTHAIESYISKVGSPEMLNLAASAVQRIFNYLPVAYEDGSNMEAREQMARASFDAGKAFNHMGLGFVHAISHQLTANYNTPHGRTNATVLPHVLKKSFRRIAHPLATLSRTAGLSSGNHDDREVAEEFIGQVLKLSQSIQIPNSIPEIKDRDIDLIVRNARKEAIGNYAVPTLLSYEECKQVLVDIKNGTKTSPN